MILFSVKDISKLNVYIYTLFTPNTLTHGKQTEKTLPQSPLATVKAFPLTGVRQLPFHCEEAGRLKQRILLFLLPWWLSYSARLYGVEEQIPGLSPRT